MRSSPFCALYTAAKEKEGDDDAPPAANRADTDKKAAAEKPAAEKPAKPETIPRLKDPSVRTMDEVKSFFQRGIAVFKATPKSSSKYPSTVKRKQNRIYTFGELVTKFGEPDNRGRINGGTAENWTYDCRDGQCFVTFQTKGYGGATGDKVDNALRLQLERVSVTSAASREK